MVQPLSEPAVEPAIRGRLPVWSDVVLIVSAGALGAIAWSGRSGLIALAVVLPALWYAAPRRVTAFLTVLSYQLAATHAAPSSFAHFYGTFLGLGVALWAMAAVTLAGAWALCWSKTARRRFAGVAVALLITALPPVGIVGWVHPLSTGGALFPDFAFYGFAATCVLCLSLCLLRPLFLCAAACAICVYGLLLATPAAAIPGWRGIDTRFAFGRGGPDPMRDFNRQLSLASIERENASANVLLFPESAAGHWTEMTTALWAREVRGRRTPLILLGGEVGDSGMKTCNALIAFDGVGASVLYRQRMPVPLSMWQPWASTGTRAYWFANPVVDVAGKRAAVFVCYEQLLVWTALQSFSRHPDVALACANDWWCSGSNIPTIQYNSAWSWARLFGVPLVSATNYAPR